MKPQAAGGIVPVVETPQDREKDKKHQENK